MNFANTSDFWDNIEEKIVELMKQKTNLKESRIRTGLSQMKHNTSLGRAMKYMRQKRRISAKKMSETLKISEADIKKIEDGEIRNYPLGLIIAYLNTLDCILSFKINELSMKG